MTLIINNDDVSKLLTMDDTIAALEKTYLDVATTEAVCRPRIDIRIPTTDPAKNYQWGTMEGGSTAGYFAIRMKSDVIYERTYNGVRTQEKYCSRPGLFCGLILLTSIETGEPLAFINDGILQHMRVGGDGGIGVKYMANPDAEVVGMLGSGGMAHTQSAGLHARAQDQEAAGLQPDEREPRALRARSGGDLRHRGENLRAPGGHLQRRAHRRRVHRFRGAGARRHPDREGRACHQYRRPAACRTTKR